MAKNILRLILSAIAIALSLRLLIAFESDPGIAYNPALSYTNANVGANTNANSGANSAITANDELTAESIDDSAVSEIAARMQADFLNIHALNSDAIGWLLIPNVCYYPILYSDTYDFYLTRDHSRSPSVQGSIFVNYLCEPNFDAPLTLIHGHNMKDKSMFGHLDKYSGQDFFDNNAPIMIFDGTLLRTYSPFTVVISAENNDVIDAQNLSDDDRILYVESMYYRSICTPKEGEPPDLASNVIFLSTCDYSFNEARLIVGAYLTDVTEIGV